ncbi:hypothetical protein BWO91_16950 [Plantibacter flavus]|uniref:hypothetical protein n=1 Tax=Plantibacter flavus TaxID=150123 RepID=UPI00099B97DD|nr:hypothetical protein [Plantibacter flavus]AQX81420.1 hypothetical protein BWO91_16950 [Plantibacter flavus]
MSETQLATEMILDGIRRVSTVPMGWDNQRLVNVSYDQTYPLQLGLHLYTSGLERLCKLALACHGLLESGSFTSVRRYLHRLSDLLDGLEQLDPTRFEVASSRYLDRPEDEFGEDLVAWLEGFASGGGRYELIDSLSRTDAEVLTWDMWAGFCSRGVVSDDVKLTMSVHAGVGNALSDVCTAADLESTTSAYVEMAQREFSQPAVAVGLAMHRRARWAAEILSAITYYTSNRLPILQEVVYVLTHPSDEFFMWEIARLSDRGVITEELTTHFEAFTRDEPDDENGALEDGDW